jgi:pimeloyl-ACP methyl ester carboxylesterase
MPPAASRGATAVLVHGAWADGSSWRRVIPLLHAKGIDVVAVQNPTTSLADDVAATRRTISAVEGPIVLVGHSWGGTVITEAGSDPKVKALVFVAAFAPDIGQSTGDQVAAHAAPPGLGEVRDRGDGTLMMSVDGWVKNVAQDLPEAEAKTLSAVQSPLGAGTFNDKVSQAAWSNRPNWYVISTEDRAVSVELQRNLAEKLNAKTTSLKASHMSLLSKPQEVADVIGAAVAAVAA